MKTEGGKTKVSKVIPGKNLGAFGFLASRPWHLPRMRGGTSARTAARPAKPFLPVQILQCDDEMKAFWLEALRELDIKV